MTKFLIGISLIVGATIVASNIPHPGTFVIGALAGIASLVGGRLMGASFSAKRVPSSSRVKR